MLAAGATDTPERRNFSITPDFDRLIARKVAWRLAPLLMACYFVAFLDRVNVGFATLR